MWEALSEWFLGLGAQYGVNPIVFGAIYVGAIPFFTLSVAWIVRNLRGGKPIALPVMAASFCLVSAYLYLFIAGENIPAWVYAVVIGLIGFGVYSTIRNVTRKVEEAARAPEEP